jgi:glycosyltransferase involved in cell wall biosynthesis
MGLPSSRARDGGNTDVDGWAVTVPAPRARTSRATPVRVMRILTRLAVAGPGFQTSLMTAGLKEFGFHTTLVAGTALPDEGFIADYLDKHGVRPVFAPAMRRPIGLGRDALALGQLVALMQRHRPTIVHTHTTKAGFLGRVAARLSGVPIVVHTFHGTVLDGYFSARGNQCLLAVERALARHTDALIALSPTLRQQVIDTYRIAAPDKIHLMPPALDLAELALSARGAGRLRAELGLLAAVPLIGAVARLAPIKNHQLLLQAFVRLPARGGHLPHLVIAGDGELNQQLRAQAASLGVTDRVHFLGWRFDLGTLYSDFDVVAMMSNNEGTPLAVIEALAAGVPVVATAVGGVRDIAGEHPLGEIVDPPFTPERYAAALERVLGSPLPRADTGARRSATAEAYSAERLCRSLAALYRQLLAGLPAR